MGSLRDAFDGVVVASDQLKPVDAALVEAGRKIADQIDSVDGLEGEPVTKALYLMPHLVNILKEMLATPAARKAAGLDVKESTGGKLANLRSIEGGRKAHTS